MQLYPALRAQMGTWGYYIVKMRMKDIVKEVGFASEVYNNRTLDEAIQRSLNEGRVKKEIVDYLAKRDDRFFASIVVAALGGNPKFYAVEITDDPQFAIFKDQGLDESFGVLTFDGGQQYFALDGQHRLKAIQTLIEADEPGVPEMPEGFRDEEVSVIMLVRQEQDDVAFLQSYRRLFSSLNRYAKPTDRDTNIIMDEDDAIAIVTRRMLIDYDFFSWDGRAETSPKLQTKGKNLRSGDSYFTTLQTLYAMNELFLSSPKREQDGFGTSQYKQHRPTEEVLDELFDELTMIWDALLSELTCLTSDPTVMREHDPSEQNEGDGTSQDHLLFWPIGQELLARLVRACMTRRLPDDGPMSERSLREAIRPLAEVDWELHNPPWRGLLLTENPETGAFRMRSEDRKAAIDCSNKLLRWKIGIDELPAEDVDDLKVAWNSLLLPRPTNEEAEDMWASFRP